MDIFENLIDEYEIWISENNLPNISANELLSEDLTEEQRLWVRDFIARWEGATEEAEEGTL